MKTRAILWCLLLPLLVPFSAQAQEEEQERGEMLFIETIKVMPEDVPAYEAAIAKVVQAAEMAGLSPDYKWAFMNDMYTYTLVFPFKDMAYWDDPDQWMRQYEGTEGEEALQAAFKEFSEIDTRVVASEVMEHVEDWSYTPATSAAADAENVHLTVFWLKSGKGDEFTQVTKDIMALLKEIGYPYPVAGHRVRFGDTNRRIFVTWFDNKSNFYGEKSLMAVIEKKGAGERWGELMSRISALIIDGDHSDAVYKPEMSYWPETQEATN